MKAKTLLAIEALVLLASCTPKADTPMAIATPTQQVQWDSSKPSPYVNNNPSVQVTRIGVIDDDLAYNSRRGIYRIADTETGTKYIGVSGIGITEVGSHRSGKSTVTDEQ